jgi:sugar transferase (PEP-CTERM/EpsH1 system associated)
MHILWLKTELLHPLDKGGRIRTYAMLRAISRTHRVTYLTLDDGRAAPDAKERGLEYAEKVITVPFSTAPRFSIRFFAELLGNVISSLPYAVSRYRSPDFTKRVYSTIRDEQPDLIVCDFLFPAVNLDCALDLPAVLFQHNVEAGIWKRHAAVGGSLVRRAYFREQWRRMQRFERETCRRFDHVIAVSEEDAVQLREEYSVPSVSAVPTGVDANFFSPSASERDPMHIVFTGAMDWLPNEDGIEWFCEDVLPTIQQVHPGAHLTIVGRNPSPRVKALTVHAGVSVTGTVPDVRPYLATAGVVIVPLRVGGGTRLKIFEALSMNSPLVSTSIGAEGLDILSGTHFQAADSARDFASACICLMADADSAARMGELAGNYVRSNFSWESIADDFIRQCGAAARRKLESASSEPLRGTA